MKLIITFIAILFSSSIYAYGFKNNLMFCQPNQSLNLNRNGTLSSISQASVQWDYQTSYSALVDGIKYPSNAIGNSVASGGAQNHDGFGFTLNYNRPVKLQLLYVSSVETPSQPYTSTSKLTDYKIEYFNGSSWITSKIVPFTDIKNGIFVFNQQGITASNWRWSFINWGYSNSAYNFSSQNCYSNYIPYPCINIYITEVEAFEYSCTQPKRW